MRALASRAYRKLLPLAYARPRAAAAWRAALAGLDVPAPAPELALAPAPDLGTIELNTACNLQCRICNTHQKQRPDGIMPVTALAEVLRQFRACGRREVSLHTIGEPLLYPHLDEVLALLRQHGFTVPRLSSNGQLLAERAELLLRYPEVIRTLRLSVDGIGERYEEQRRGASFARLMEGIERFHRLNRRAPRDRRIPLRIDSVLLRDNLAQTHAFLEYFRRYCPLDAIHFHVALTFDAISDYIVRNGLLQRHMRGNVPCSAVGRGAVIHFNGDVSMCCRDYHGDLVIGNILTDSLSALWGGERQQRLLAEHRDNAARGCPSCTNCAAVDARFARVLETAVPHFYCRYARRPERHAAALARCLLLLETADGDELRRGLRALDADTREAHHG